MPAMRAFLMVVFGLAVSCTGARAECFVDWGAARAIVKREGLADVEALQASKSAAITGQIMKTTLCQDGGRYVYRLVVREANGRLKTVTVEAGPAGAPASSAVKAGVQ